MKTHNSPQKKNWSRKRKNAPSKKCGLSYTQGNSEQVKSIRTRKSNLTWWETHKGSHMWDKGFTIKAHEAINGNQKTKCGSISLGSQGEEKAPGTWYDNIVQLLKSWLALKRSGAERLLAEKRRWCVGQLGTCDLQDLTPAQYPS